MSVSFMHLPDAREQFAASSCFPDLRLLLEDHHIVLSRNLTCSQELVLARFPRKQKLWIQCPQELCIHISRVLASSSCLQGLLLLPDIQWLLKAQTSSFCSIQKQSFISCDNSYFPAKHPLKDSQHILASISLQFSDLLHQLAHTSPGYYMQLTNKILRGSQNSLGKSNIYEIEYIGSTDLFLFKFRARYKHSVQLKCQRFRQTQMKTFRSLRGFSNNYNNNMKGNLSYCSY